jgi:SNF2 family DNA or RNA helicase
MKTILDKATRDELIARAKALNISSKPQWGKMSVDQMLKHAILADEMYLGKKVYKRQLLGYLLGKTMLKSMLKDETPMKKHATTSPDFIVTETGGNVEAEKARWIGVLEEYGNYNNPEFMHWFFGKMTKEQVGQFAYKHADHHLRQFNS